MIFMKFVLVVRVNFFMLRLKLVVVCFGILSVNVGNWLVFLDVVCVVLKFWSRFCCNCWNGCCRCCFLLFILVFCVSVLSRFSDWCVIVVFCMLCCILMGMVSCVCVVRILVVIMFLIS